MNNQDTTKHNEYIESLDPEKRTLYLEGLENEKIKDYIENMELDKRRQIIFALKEEKRKAFINFWFKQPLKFQETLVPCKNKDDFINILSQNITKISINADSIMLCGKYCRTAIQATLGEEIEPWDGMASEFGPYLLQRKFKDLGSLQESEMKFGDVVVMQEWKNCRPGHIQIFCTDGKWKTDYVQDGFWPDDIEGDFPKYNVFRYEG